MYVRKMEFVWLAVYSDQNSVHILYSIYIFTMKYTSNANACMPAHQNSGTIAIENNKKQLAKKKVALSIIFKENLKISDFILKNYFVTTAIVD